MTLAIPLESIRTCFEGLMPALLASVDGEGTPNVTYVSQVHYVDAAHVALTYQFFNKTRRNMHVNPRVAAYLSESTLVTG